MEDKFAGYGATMNKERCNPLLSEHTIKDGETILVAQMDDKHLLAVIQLHCKAIRNARVAIKDMDQNIPDIVKQTQHLNLKEYRERVLSEMNFRLSLLPKYVFFAAHRNLDVSVHLNYALDYEGVVPRLPDIALKGQQPVLESECDSEEDEQDCEQVCEDGVFPYDHPDAFPCGTISFSADGTEWIDNRI